MGIRGRYMPFMMLAVLLFSSCMQHYKDIDDLASEREKRQQEASFCVPQYLTALEKHETVKFWFTYKHGGGGTEYLDEDAQAEILSMICSMEATAHSARAFFDDSAEMWNGISSEVHFGISYGDGEYLHIALKEDGLLYIELSEHYGYVYQPAKPYREEFQTYFNTMFYGTPDVFLFD